MTAGSASRQLLEIQTMVCEKPTEGELLPGQLITVWGKPTESESLYWDVDPWYSHHHARQGSG